MVRLGNAEEAVPATAEIQVDLMGQVIVSFRLLRPEGFMSNDWEWSSAEAFVRSNRLTGLAELVLAVEGEWFIEGEAPLDTDPDEEDFHWQVSDFTESGDLEGAAITLLRRARGFVEAKPVPESQDAFDHLTGDWGGIDALLKSHGRWERVTEAT